MAGGGGAAQDAQRKAFFEPTAKALGIKINEATVNFIQEVRLQVQSGAVSWDIVELGADDCAVGSKEGLWEPLDFNIVKTDGIDPKLVGKDWVGYFYYSTVLAWNTGTVPQGMNTWADFFNVDKFPGERGVYNYPRGNLEMALLADGVEPSKLYPLDVDRAFKKLAELKPHVGVWWESGAQSAQLIKDGSVDMLEIWNGRVNAVIKDGAAAKYTFNQGILNADCIAIPKGSKHKDLAMKALAMFISPELQARFPLYIDYGPINSKAFETGVLTQEQIDANLASPKNIRNQVIVDSDWWAKNMAAMTERWNNFRQE
ncbi:MAG TPA: ABC transporter substrate-binding protein [Dongiaceae bacterium]|nr:ABC transporter substrate-binding protein [Dongiaceae bacterium]